MSNGRADKAGTEEGLGLAPSFYERLEAAPLEEKLSLAREAAGQPGFDTEDAFELGMRLVDALEAAGRYAELEGVLDRWKELAPQVHDSEPTVLTWRVELALRLPERDVAGPLLLLARKVRSSGLVRRLAEWCLYRGRVREAYTGLLAAWVKARAQGDLFEGALEEYLARLLLTALDLALEEAPGLPRERLRERLESLAEQEVLEPRWVEQAVSLRTGREAWSGLPGALAALSTEELLVEQQALVMALEPELRVRHGWPRGRTQLVQPVLLELLPGHPEEAGRVLAFPPRPSALLLPETRVLARWVEDFSDDRYFHPHAHAATALALRPWGDFLHRLGLLDAGERAAWHARVSRLLGSLVEQFAKVDDPALADELREALGGA
jgi:hypothetical protein